MCVGGRIGLALTQPSQTFIYWTYDFRAALRKFLQEFTVVRSERSLSAIVRILDVSYDILGYHNRTN